MGKRGKQNEVIGNSRPSGKSFEREDQGHGRGLFDHPKMAVRYYAATELLAIEPVRARAIIQDVKDHGPSPLAGDAGGTLRMLDDGTFIPT